MSFRERSKKNNIRVKYSLNRKYKEGLSEIEVTKEKIIIKGTIMVTWK